jgi:hypothetical protein
VHDGFEDVSVADLADAADGLLLFEAVDGGLDGGVGGPVAFRESIEDIADADLAPFPECLHDP